MLNFVCCLKLSLAWQSPNWGGTSSVANGSVTLWLFMFSLSYFWWLRSAFFQLKLRKINKTEGRKAPGRFWNWNQVCFATVEVLCHVIPVWLQVGKVGVWKSCWTLQQWTVAFNMLQNSAANHQKITPTELLSPGMPLGELTPVLRAAPSAGTGVLLTHWAVQAWSNFWGCSWCLWLSGLFWWLKEELEECSHTPVMGWWW